MWRNVPTKTTEYTVGMNFNLYNDANKITVNGTDSIAINGGKFVAGSGSINLNSPQITAASGTVFDAATKTSSSKIDAAEGVNVEDFTVTGMDLPSGDPDKQPLSNNETVNKVLNTLPSSVDKKTKAQMAATIEEENDMVVAAIDQEISQAESVDAEDSNVRAQAAAIENTSDVPANTNGLEVADNVSFTVG